ncbi:MAG TPA: alkane 1-monooxygenase [Vicinamibacterales bacterium]
MTRALPHLAGFLLPAALVLGAWMGGPGTLLPLALVLIVLPAADLLTGVNAANAEDQAGPLGQNVWFRAITWLWVPVHAAMLVWAASTAASGRLSYAELAGLTISTGVIAGTVGITFAHELIHRPGRFERALGEALLSLTSYAHFAIEHVYGHHRRVGTPDDPATARLGESLYRFLPRCVAGSLRSAAAIEAHRLTKRGRRPYHWSNRFYRYASVQIALYAGAGWLWGSAGAVFVAGQAVIAFLLLETINYIEHYGLTREEIAPGRFERIAPGHSWNSSHRVSNWLLINLARHSDHHQTAAKRYQVLDHLAGAPQLPAGYGAMFVAALVPPLWRRVMDPRVAAARQANQPR